MERIEQTIEVDRPLRTVYNQWTQFEEFPRFMDGVKEVTQLDDTHVRWHAELFGKDKEWDAEITEQVPDQVIAWRATSGAQNTGRVQFHGHDEHTHVSLELDVEPQGAAQQAGDMLGVLKQQVRSDLTRFKELIESRGEASGAWRGEVQHGETQ